MNDRLRNIGKALIFALIPLVACFIYAALQGVMIWEIDPYASIWNDEVFYYKQIEAIVNGGAPWGYFGYNCSAAEVGTFGAWPVTLLLPYALIGLVFGISPYHMLAFNMLLIVVAFGVFYLLAKPDFKQSVVMAVLFFTYPYVMRYILSGMVEPILYAAMIVVTGFAVNFYKFGLTKTKLVICYIIIVYFALCRPWYMIFIIIPMAFNYKYTGPKSIIPAILSVIIFGFLYLFWIVPRCAAYLIPSLNMEVIKVLFTDGVCAFIKAVVYKTSEGLITISGYLLQAYSIHSAIFYTLFILICYIVIMTVINMVKKKSVKNIQLYITAAIIFMLICVGWAIILFYSTEQIFRHCIVFVICINLIIPIFYKPEKNITVFLLAAVLAAAGWYGINNNQFIFYTEENSIINKDICMQAQEILNPIKVDKNADNWDNTVVLIYEPDIINYAYALPSNVGINLCFDDYVKENINEIKAKYMLTYSDSTDRDFYIQNNWKCVAETESFVLYSR